MANHQVFRAVHPNRFRVFSLLVIPALLVFATTLCRAGDTAEEWRPPAPSPDDFDWVQLTSGEWLKGELIALYERELEFDSDKLKLLKLKWKDVNELRSAETVQVGMNDGSVLIGRIVVQGETFHFPAVDDRSRRRSEIVTITPGAPKEINNWNAKVSLGANFRSGNTEQIETTTKGDLIRRTAKSRLNLGYLAAFNQTDGVKATDNQRATGTWSRYYSKRLFWTPLYGEWYRDPLQNISSRWTIGTGLGYDFIDTPETGWEVGGGIAYQTTQFDSVAEGDAPSVNTPAFVAKTTFDHELNGWTDVLLEYSFMVVNRESGRFTHHLLGGLEFDITDLFDIEVTATWDHIQNPQEDAEGVVPEQDDYRLILFLGLDF